MKQTLKIIFLAVFYLSLFLNQPLNAQAVRQENGYDIQSFPAAENLNVGGDSYICIGSRGMIWIIANNGIGKFNGKSFDIFHDSTSIKIFNLLSTHAGYTGIWHNEFYIATSNCVWQYTGMVGKPFNIVKLLDPSFQIKSYKPFASNQAYVTFSNKPGIWLLKNNLLKNIGGSGKIMVVYQAKQGVVYANQDGDSSYYVLKAGQILRQVFTKHALKLIANDDDVEDDVWALGNKWLYKLGDSGPQDSIFFNYKGSASTSIDIFKGREANVFYCRVPRTANSAESTVVKYKNGKWEKISDLNPVNGTEDAAGNYWVIVQGILYRILKSLYTKVASQGNLLRYGSNKLGNTIITGVDAVLPARLSAAGVLKQWWCANGNKWYASTTGLYLKPVNKNYNFFPELKYFPRCEDESGTIWFKDDKGYINYYKNGSFFHLPETGDNIPRCDNMLLKDGLLYFSGKEKGIYVYDTRSLKLLASLPTNEKSYLFKDKAKNIWTIWNGRLNKIVLDSSEKLLKLTSSITQPGINNIEKDHLIDFDNHNNLWVCNLVSNKTISVFLVDGQGKYVSPPILIPHLYRYAQASPICGADGRMYFITNDATDNPDIYSIDVDSAIAACSNKNTPISVPFLTNINIFNKPQYWPNLNVATDSFGIPIHRKFTYDQNMLSFSFSAISPSFPQSIIFQYKLQGLEKDWQPTNENEVSYTNLAPGKYTLLVRAADVRLQWTKPLAYPFIITPPWYKTLFALIIWWILGIGVAFFVFYQWQANVKRRERLKRMVVEQQLIALRAQINPHFLHNTFEFLSHSLNEQPIKYAQKIIGQLSQYLRNVLNLSDKTVITLEDEITFSDEYLAINKLLFNNSFSYNIDIGEEVDTFGIKLPSMLLQPLLENAIKHGVRFTGNHHAAINVRIYADANNTYCAISNTTVVASENSKTVLRPTGLNITEQRLLLLFGHTKHRQFITANSSTNLYEVIVTIPS